MAQVFYFKKEIEKMKNEIISKRANQDRYQQKKDKTISKEELYVIELIKDVRIRCAVENRPKPNFILVIDTNNMFNISLGQSELVEYFYIDTDDDEKIRFMIQQYIDEIDVDYKLPNNKFALIRVLIERLHTWIQELKIDRNKTYQNGVIQIPMLIAYYPTVTLIWKV